MGELPPNYNNKDQLPLYGRVYNPVTNEYEYTIAGETVMMASRPLWEEVVELREVNYASEYVWLGVQPPSVQTEEPIMTK